MDVVILLQGMVPVPGRPVTGNGLRAHALREGLRGRGHRVRLLTRAVDAEDVPAEVAGEDELLRYDDLADVPAIVRAAGAEAAIVCHWELLAALPQPFSIPVVADLYGPRLVETQFEGLALDREAAAFVDQLRRADAFLVASERQRWFALPWLLLAGFDARTAPIEVVPLATSPALRPPKPSRELRVVSGGVFWPWRVSESPLARLLGVLERTGSGVLDLYGGSYPLATEAPVPYRDPRDRLPESPRLVFHGMRPYDELLERYAGASLAFDVMERNTERELSFSFRVVDYLAAGLPVVTNHFTEIAAEIERAEAGWRVDVDARGELETLLEHVLADRKELRRRGRNAQRLAAERYTWDRAVAPLDAWLRAPRRAERSVSVLTTLLGLSNEVFEAREERLREIERSRKALRRTEEQDRLLGELRSRTDELAGQLQWTRTELDAKAHSLEQAQARETALRVEGTLRAAEVEAARSERDAARERLEGLRASARQSEAARDRAERLRQEIDGLRGESEDVRKRLEAEAAATHATLAERDRRLAHLHEELLAHQRAAAAERERLATAAADQLAARDADLRAARDREAELRRELDRFAAQAAQLVRERDTLAAAADTLAKKLDGRVAKLEEAAREAAGLRVLAERRAGELERERAAREQAHAAAVEREREAHGLRDRLARTEDEIVRLKGALEDAAREREAFARQCRVEYDQLAGRLVEEQRSAAAAREAFERQARGEYEALAGRLAEAERGAAALRDQLERREAALREAGDANVRLRGEIERGESLVGTLRGQLDAALSETTAVRGENARLDHEAAAKDRDLVWYRETLDARDGALRAELERRTTAEAALDELRRSLAFAQADLAAVRANGEKLERGVAELEAERLRLVGSVERLRASPLVRLWGRFARRPEET